MPNNAAIDVEIARVFRTETGRAVATLMRIFGDLTLAEDCVQEAFSLAILEWSTGLPPNPGAWIVHVAKNKAIDRARRESQRKRREQEAFDLRFAPDDGETEARALQEQLPLLFLCCHPALNTDAQVALTLRMVGGLQTPEIARAFLIPEVTLAQRLVRAKRKIQAANIPYCVPEAEALPERLNAVLRAIYLVFNEGYATSTSGVAAVRADLCVEAIRLGRQLLQMMPDESEILGLLALMLLLDARRLARFTEEGELVVLARQDRALWDRGLADEGMNIVRQCLSLGRPGPYQIQAAINAVHCDAPHAAATDWPQILALYDQLFTLNPTSIVALNRAVALAEVQGPEAALALVEPLDLAQYHLLHAVRGNFLARLGRKADAVAAYARALELTQNPAEREHLSGRIRELGADG